MTDYPKDQADAMSRLGVSHPVQGETVLESDNLTTDQRRRVDALQYARRVLTSNVRTGVLGGGPRLEGKPDPTDLHAVAEWILDGGELYPPVERVQVAEDGPSEPKQDLDDRDAEAAQASLRRGWDIEDKARADERERILADISDLADRWPEIGTVRGILSTRGRDRDEKRRAVRNIDYSDLEL